MIIILIVQSFIIGVLIVILARRWRLDYTPKIVQIIEAVGASIAKSQGLDRPIQVQPEPELPELRGGWGPVPEIVDPFMDDVPKEGGWSTEESQKDL